MLHPLCTHSAKTDTCLVRVQDPPTSSSGFYFEYSSNKTHIWASYFHSMLLSHSSPLKNSSICFSKCFSLFILQSSQNKLKLLTLIVFSWFGHFTSVILSFERANSAQSSCLLSLWKWLVSDVVEHRGPLGLFNNNKKILLFKLKKKNKAHWYVLWSCSTNGWYLGMFPQHPPIAWFVFQHVLELPS